MTADTVPALIDGVAEGQPDAPAIFYHDQTLSYAELAALGRRLATGLAGLGVGRGDRVAFWLPNTPAYLGLYLGCARLGAIAVAVNTRFRGAEVADIVARSGAKVLALWPGFKAIDFLGILGQVPAEALSSLGHVVVCGEAAAVPKSASFAAAHVVHYNDLTLSGPCSENGAAPDLGVNIFTTSGTTSRPKFVLLSHYAISRHARDVARAHGYLEDGSVGLQALPYCGVFGFSQTMATLAAARPMALMESFDAAEAVALAIRHRCTHMNGSDEMYLRMFEEADRMGASLAGFRRCGFAAFNTDAETLVGEADRRGMPLTGVYGMSEVQALFTVKPVDEAVEKRAPGGGFPVSAEAALRVRDPETGALLPPGEAGELELRGPSMLSAYYGDAEATAAVFTEDGFVRSGDLGRIEADGRFVFISRMGDALRLGGFLVAPEEIAGHIEQVPGVAACQVVGVAQGRQTRVVAFVLCRADAAVTEEALLAHCRAGLAGFKQPARVVFLDAFPMAQSANGVKIQRAKLRRMAEDYLSTPA